MGRALDAATNITISVGASEALYACMQAFVEPGDEVVVIEPAFDLYLAQARSSCRRPPPRIRDIVTLVGRSPTSQTQMAGGVTKYCPLRLNPDTRGEQLPPRGRRVASAS